MTLDPKTIRRGDKFTVEYTATMDAAVLFDGKIYIQTSGNGVRFNLASPRSTLTSITRAPWEPKIGDEVRPKRNRFGPYTRHIIFIDGDFIAYQWVDRTGSRGVGSLNKHELELAE